MYLISLRAHQMSYGSLIPQYQRAKFDARYTDSPAVRTNYVDKMRGKLIDSAWKAWVAEIDGRIVGYTLEQRVNQTLVWKKGLFVEPDCHGRGVGEALFKASLIGAGAASTVRLVVIGNNGRARRLYEKYGFVATGYSQKKFYGARQLLMEGCGLTFTSKNVKINHSELRNKQQPPPDGRGAIRGAS